MTDSAFASDGLSVGVQAPLHDQGREQGVLVVARYDADATAWAAAKLGRQPAEADFARLGIAPYQVTTSESNLITTAGWSRILDKAIGNAGQAWDATHTRIGVGTGTTAATVADTDLAAATGATTRRWELVTALGVVGAGVGTRRLSFAATFGTADGNFSWQEFGCDQGTASGTGASVAPLLNRAVSNQGTKASGQTWTTSLLLDFT